MKLATYMLAAHRIDHFSGAVLVAVHGKVIYSHGFGFANLADRIPNGSETEFHIGSNTKQFTAAAILLLRDRGKLRLRDRICQFIPKCPAAWRQITIFELLTHTSGIPNYTDMPGFWHRVGKAVSRKELLETFKNRPLDFKPGARFRYSNSGYVLLGLIIRRVSGEPYREFLERNLFLRLGLHHTAYDNYRLSSRRALGYEQGSEGLQPAPHVDPSWTYSAGALHSSVRDLYIWDQSLMTQRLLSSRSLHDMFTPQVHIQCGLLGSATRKCGYGLGLMIGDTYGHKEISHGGEFPGFLSVNAFFPRRDIVVIAYDNHFSWVVREVTNALVAIVFNEPYTVPGTYKAIKLVPSSLQRFVGRYRLMSDFTITISRHDDQLFERASGQSPLPIYPYGPESFFLEDVDAQIEFNTDKFGKIDGMTLHQEGMVMSGRKITKP